MELILSALPEAIVKCVMFLVYRLIFAKTVLAKKIKIKSSLHSRYYTTACNEWRSPFRQIIAQATQLGRNVSAVASR